MAGMTGNLCKQKKAQLYKVVEPIKHRAQPTIRHRVKGPKCLGGSGGTLMRPRTSTRYKRSSQIVLLAGAGGPTSLWWAERHTEHIWSVL